MRKWMLLAALLLLLLLAGCGGEAAPGGGAARPEPDSGEADPLGLMADGGGDIRMFVSDSATGLAHELDGEQALALLSAIDFSVLREATVRTQIVLPDPMAGEAGTPGEYIVIGTPFTSQLCVFDGQEQALLLSAEGDVYYDMPGDFYRSVKICVDGL